MRAARIAWTIVSLIVVEVAVCGAAAAPVVFVLRWLHAVVSPDAAWIVLAAALAPAYLAFVLLLLVVSPLVTRALGWRTPLDAEMRIADCGWPLLAWARGIAALHLCRVLGGTLLHGTPVWTAHLRLGGARLGRRVYVNSLRLSDYNLIECGHDVVIGDDAHLSGHTVEAGVVKTGRVAIGDNVTIGLGSVIDIDVTVGSNVQIGALSFVPKHARVAGGAVYAGIPIRRLASTRMASAARHDGSSR
jgi:hypothetical protein